MASCCHCRSQSIVQDYEQAFGVAVCSACRKYEPTISKSNAKSTYLLSDADLARLGHLERQNPRHKEFSAMKMLLVSQVEEVAVQKHGSLAAVAEEKQRRVKDKIEGRVRRRAAEVQAAAVAQQVAARVAAAVGRHSAQPAGQQAQEEDFVDPETGKRQKRFAPEYAAADVEEF
ncbi:hypothetical protein OEZ85_012927 [Tetradesmus obliquus]|uniref:Uncharacterized protein n=2 Tax=Tetradesmus obliquus TaxID=3088 RepID=A0A383VA47_TETOB|nr:hypothetical protein OEZ85_012927 [Tetradesmus obliquus]|eukprot:jgi/Sobl393_1/11043/SZX62061.1